MDAYQSHTVALRPEDADIILFATNYTFIPAGLGVLGERTFRRFASRCVVFDSSDEPSPIIGGLCASWSKQDLAPGLATGWCYHHPTSAEATLQYLEWPRQSRYLWSFLGAFETDPVRAKLAALGDKESFVDDTSKYSLPNLRGETSGNERQKFYEKYANLLSESAFVVCPRGRGPSSMRLFEAMRAGRTPVIISDAWTPPPFVAWDKCSFRIPESEVATLPEFLRAHQDAAKEMGDHARAEWERVFGPTGLFHHTVEACLTLVKARPKDYTRKNIERCGVLLRPPWRRRFLRGCKQVTMSSVNRMLGRQSK